MQGPAGGEGMDPGGEEALLRWPLNEEGMVFTQGRAC